MKLLRIILTVLSAILMPVGIFLINVGNGSSALADGTADLKLWWGYRVLVVGIYLLVSSIALWAARLIERVKYENWKAGKVTASALLGAFWKTLVLMPIVIMAFILIAPRISNAMSAKVAEEHSGPEDAESKIAKDFDDGTISADEYVNYLIDQAYAQNELPEKYYVDGPAIMPDILSVAEENYDSLSDETKLNIYNTVFLGNMAIGTDASGNIASKSKFFGNDVYAKGNVYVTTLNKAKKSANGNFIVFYTDTGDDKISDKQAEELATMLDRIVAGYKSELGMDYNLEIVAMDMDTLGGTKNVLEENGISMDDYWKAMPVYVVNPMVRGETSTYASYVGRVWSEFGNRVLVDVVSAGNIVFNEDDRTVNMYRSAPSLPFINIMPKNAGQPGLELVTAHEVGHHYAGEYAIKNFGDYSKTGKFISETVANYMANRVVKNQPTDSLLADHHDNYIEYGFCYPIDQVIPEPYGANDCHSSGSFAGYPQFSFLQNYVDVVPGGHKKIMDGIYTENTLEHLYNQAGDTLFRSVMKVQSQNTLLNNYSTNSLKAHRIPAGEKIPCTDFCEKTYTIFPASLRYLYFTKSEFVGKKVIVSGDGLDFSLMAGTNDNYSLVDSAADRLEFEIKEDSPNNRFAVAISNPSITDDKNYTLEITDAEAEEMFDEETTEDVKLGDDFNIEDIFKIRGNCADINVKGLLDLSAKLTSSITGLYGELYSAMGYDEAANELDAEVAQIQSDVEEAKKNVNFNTLTVCEKVFKEGKTYNDAVNFATKKMSHNIRLYENNEDGIHMGVYATYNIWNGKSKAYLLWQDDTDNRVRLYNFSVK